jgi:hypothetical protein
MATKSELIDADILARFAELTSEEVEDFRHSVAPGFVPEPWWEFDGQKIRDWKMWQEMQALVRDTWDAGFSGEYTISLLMNHAYVRDQAEPDEGYVFPYEIYRAMPYQNAAMFLFNQSWRARRCNRPDCRKRFVAKEANDQFCSVECRKEFRRQYKAAHIRERRQAERKATANHRAKAKR